MATLDPVSGAYFRRFFEQWMVRELRAAYSTRQPASLLLADIDGMKGINDAAGHLAGDQALAIVGTSLKEAVRTSDIVGRYGGDEFAVMLPQTSFPGAERVGLRVLSLVSQKTVHGGAVELPLAVSLGLAVLEPPQASSAPRPSTRYFETVAKALFQRADEALYEAKRAGGNRLGHGEPLMWVDREV
jgi:diguanylate cyclase (GGDEF)-like protein